MPDDTEVIDEPSSPAGESGLAKFMSDVTSDIGEDSAKGTDTSSPKPEAKPAAPAKPVEKQVESKPAPAKPAAPKAEAKPADKPSEKPAKPDDMNSLRKRYEEVNGELSKERQTKAALEKKLDELSKKRVWSEDDEKKVAKYEEELSNVKKELAATSYERSDEFKQKFRQPWDNAIENAVNMVKQMRVVEGDGFRAGVDADFWKVAGSPVSEQAEKAQALFGVNAPRILSAIDRLTDLKYQADIAIKNHSQSYEESAKTKESQTRKEQQDYESAHRTASEELEKMFPQYFGKPEEDPEIVKQMEQGYSFVDKASTEAMKLPPTERAEYAAVVRARAAAFPRLVFERKRDSDKIAALESELAKYRGSDPNNARGDSGGGKPAKEEGAAPTGGIDAMIKEFD